MTARVIGLGGRLRAGKDEVAGYLAREHGFRVLGMSDALHEAMLALNPIIEATASCNYMDDAELERWTYREAIAEYGYVRAKEMFPEVRRLLQRLGTEVGRDMFGENVWVNIMARKIGDHLRAGASVAVTGIRFENELRMVRQFAGTAVWVERPGGEAAASAASHASENGVTADLFDVTIANDGTLEDLYRKADAL